MNENWNWWTQETTEEKLIKPLIQKAIQLERLPTVQEIIDDPKMPRLYSLARYFDSAERALAKVANVLYGNARRTYPTELLGKQKKLSAEQQEAKKVELLQQYRQNLQDLQHPGVLREKLRGYQKLSSLTELAPGQKVIKIPVVRRIRLSEYAKDDVATSRQNPKVPKEEVVAKPEKNELENTRSLAKTLAAETVCQVVETIATQVVQMDAANLAEEEDDMSRKKYTVDDAIEALRAMYQHYKVIPNSVQAATFLKEREDYMSYATFIKLVGSTKGWAELLGFKIMNGDEANPTSVEEQPVGAEPSECNGASGMPLPENDGGTPESISPPMEMHSREIEEELIPANTSTQPISGENLPAMSETGVLAQLEPEELVTVKLTGSLNAEVCRNGRRFRMQIQLGELL